jgi:hypothetical protein
MTTLLSWSLLLLGCAEPEEAARCALGEGTSFLSDGVAANGSAGWIPQDTSLQVNVNVEEGELSGARLTLRLQQTMGGQEAMGALEAGPFPIDFSLGVAEQAAAIWYPPQATSSLQADSSVPGTLVVHAFDGESLEGCFSFEGRPSRGRERVQITEGTFFAVPAR